MNPGTSVRGLSGTVGSSAHWPVWESSPKWWRYYPELSNNISVDSYVLLLTIFAVNTMVDVTRCNVMLQRLSMSITYNVTYNFGMMQR